MLKPPPMPPAALLGGKISVAAGWLFGLFALLASTNPTLNTAGYWLLIGLGGSHVLELAIFMPFLKAAKASAADYVQVFLFGVFHSSGMTAP